MIGGAGLMIGTASAPADGFAERGYDRAIDVQLSVGVVDYRGIESASIELLLETTSDDETRLVLLNRARNLGENFGNHSDIR